MLTDLSRTEEERLYAYLRTVLRFIGPLDAREDHLLRHLAKLGWDAATGFADLLQLHAARVREDLNDSWHRAIEHVGRVRHA